MQPDRFEKFTANFTRPPWRISPFIFRRINIYPTIERNGRIESLSIAWRGVSSAAAFDAFVSGFTASCVHFYGGFNWWSRKSIPGYLPGLDVGCLWMVLPCGNSDFWFEAAGDCACLKSCYMILFYKSRSCK